MIARNFKAGLTLALFAVASWALPKSAAAQTYKVYDLGDLGGGLSVGLGVNDCGAAVGSSQTAAQANEAFFWTLGKGIVGIGDLGGGDSNARAINDFHKIVGDSVTTAGDTHAFVWSSGVFTDLGTLAGTTGTNSFAYGINDFGADPNGRLSSSYETVVGDSDTSVGVTEAFLWNKAKGLVALGSLGGGESHARAINDLNKITGYSTTAGGDTHAFVWSNGKFTDLGTLAGTPGSQSLANAINDFDSRLNTQNETVVGTSNVAGGDLHAFRWSSSTGIVDLGTLAGAAGFNSFALGVSDAGQIVGASDTLSGDTHAFLWDSKNGLRDLNSLIPANSGWDLNEATGISKDGFIVGFGLFNGATHAFLLSR